jgi:hypothetical protein
VVLQDDPSGLGGLVFLYDICWGGIGSDDRRIESASDVMC